MAVNRITRKLNLVVEIERGEDESPLYIHSTPIRREVFDTYFLLIGKTFTAVYAQGLGAISGPRVADRLLRQIADEMGVWADAEKGLIAEIHRLTVVLAPGDEGWQTVPYDEARKTNLLSEDDASEVDSALAFFTVASWMYRKSEAKTTLAGAMELWGARLESSSSTEYRNSLPTWKPPVSTGGTPTT